MHGIPVLMYHHVNPAGNALNVVPELFERQMGYLASAGYRTIDTSDLLDILSTGRRPHWRSVMITFDDGWLDNYLYAFPVLKEFNLKAVVFVVTSWAGERGVRTDKIPLPRHKDCVRLVHEDRSGDVVLSWDELSEMESSGLIDVQSHTHSHIRWDREVHEEERIAVLREDLETSKSMIEEKLNKPCNALCWPWGKGNVSYVKTAQEVGFRMLFTTEKGTNKGVEDLKGIKRIVIGNIKVTNLKKKLFIYSRPGLSRFYLRIFG